jgi:RNA polymerase sigma factor (sigma-70 family)
VVARQLIRGCRISSELAEELIAAATVRLMSRQATARSPAALLITTAKHELFEELSRARRHAEHAAQLARDGRVYGELFPDGQHADPANQVAGEDEVRAKNSLLYRSLTTLSVADRSLLTERYFEEKPLSEIARDRGWSPDATKSHLWRARLRLRREYQRELTRGP